MILSKKPTAVKGPWLSLSQIATVAVMTAVGFAAHSAIQNRSLTEEQSRRAAEIAAVGSLIPVDHNPAVHAMLVKYTTTPEGRNRMKQALARLPEVKALIESKAKQYGLPADLLVIPMYESGFKAKSISSMKALGMWQFIPQTAERYGMHAQTEPQNMVEGKDDRLDPVKETDSAMRYLRDLHRQFGDWRLAIKAYNEGEVAVDRLMKKQGTRDPWALDRAWKGEDYLAGAIATLIIYKNPSLLD